jgi:hypothetical protein
MEKLNLKNYLIGNGIVGRFIHHMEQKIISGIVKNVTLQEIKD